VMVSLPSIVFVEAALVDVLRLIGVEPSAALGHSTGEMVAAYALGCIDRCQLVSLCHARAFAQSQMRDGSMCVFSGSQREAIDVLESLRIADDACVACLNSGENVTLSGESSAIRKFVEVASSKRRCTELNISRAYHSSHVDDVETVFLTSLSEFGKTSKPNGIFISTTVGRIYDGEIDERFWFANMRETVNFLGACQGLNVALDGENVMILELSPHPVLSGYLSENCPKVHCKSFQHKSKRNLLEFLSALGGLFTSGLDIDWSHLVTRPVAQLSIPRMVWIISLQFGARPGKILAINLPMLQATLSEDRWKWDVLFFLF